MSPFVVPTKPERGTDEDRDRAVALGAKIKNERLAKWAAADGKAFDQRWLAHELARDGRTVDRLLDGDSPRLTFGNRAGQQNVSLLEQGKLVSSGSGPSAKFVGMGIQLICDIEDILGLPRMYLPAGIYYEPAESPVGESLRAHILRAPEINDGKRRLLLHLLDQYDA